MTQQTRIRDLETKNRSVARWYESNQELDALNLILDDAIAQVEAENRRSPAYVDRLEKAKLLLNSLKQEKLGQDPSRGEEATKDCMANLPAETVTTVFNLQRRLWELITQATATDWAILEQYGETEATITALEQLDNLRKRLTAPYSRLHILLLQLGEFQPKTSAASLDLLAEIIEQAQAMVEAAKVSIQETKRDLNLP